jgi:hypothetical protein
MIASKRFFKMIRNLRFLSASPFIVARDGDYPEAFEPELWANESIAILEGNMVAGNLVHRDFEEAIASYGQVVNTRKPSEFQIKRKVRNDSVVVQQPDADNIPVVLNQHLYVTFLILDVDQTKSFKDLVATYLQPAMLTIAEGVDNIVSGQVYQFLQNNGGQLNMMDSTNAEDYILDARLVMNKNKAYTMNRNLLLGPVAETTALKDDKFTDANRVGDDGTALREASLGRKFGNDIFMAQSQPYIDSTALDVVTGAINQSAATRSARRPSRWTAWWRRSRPAPGSPSRATTPRSRSSRRSAAAPRPASRPCRASSGRSRTTRSSRSPIPARWTTPPATPARRSASADGRRRSSTRASPSSRRSGWV